MDYYSLWPEVYLLTRPTSENLIEAIKDSFSRNGIVDELISDNGPQYSSYKFRKFAREWQFDHSTSSPHFPQSNGLAEAGQTYLVKLSSGQSIRRNQRFLRKVYSLSSHEITDSMLANSQEDDSDEESDSTIPYPEDFGEESDREEYDEEQLSIEEESDATVPYGDERVNEMAETKTSHYGRRIRLKQPVDYDEL